MEWIVNKKQPPLAIDLPFVTFKRHIQSPTKLLIFSDLTLWQDALWFDKLTEEERAEWQLWAPVEPHKATQKMRNFCKGCKIEEFCDEEPVENLLPFCPHLEIMN